MGKTKFGRFCTRILCAVVLPLGSGCFSEDFGTPVDDGLATGTAGQESTASAGEMSTTDQSTTDQTSSTSDASTGTAPTGELRAVHAAAGLGPVDIYAVGNPAPLFEAIEYADATTWVEMPVGSWTFEFRPAGAAADSTPVHTSAPVSVEEASRVTAIAAGSIGAQEEASAFRVLAVEEQWGAPLEARARARWVHAGPDAPAFGVDGVEVEGTIERFESTEAEGFGLDSVGGQRLALLEDVQGDPATITSFTMAPVGEGDEVLLIAAGNLNELAREPGGFTVIAVGRDGALGFIRQDPQLFVLHGSRDAASLEACTGDTELAANLSYGEIASARVSPGTYDVSIHSYPSGCGATVFSTNSTGALEAGERYLLLVTGEVSPEDGGEAGIQVTTFDDAYPLDDDQGARLRFVHGASYSQIYVGAVVDGEISAANVLTQPIAWSVESGEVAIPAGSYVVGIADAVGKPSPPYAPIVTVDYEAIGGARQWIIAAGDPSPEETDGGALGFLQLIVVDTTTPLWGVAIVDVDLPTL